MSLSKATERMQSQPRLTAKRAFQAGQSAQVGARQPTAGADARDAGRCFRLDTGAARAQLASDDYLASLTANGQDISAGIFGQTEVRDVVTVAGFAVGGLIAAMSSGRPHRTPAEPARHGRAARALLSFPVRDGLLELTGSPAPQAGLELHIGGRGHAFISARFDGVALTTWLR